MENLPLKGASSVPVTKMYKTDDRLYEKLQYLSNNIYAASINKIVVLAVERLYETENVKPYPVDYMINYLKRSYRFNQGTLDKLELLHAKYPGLARFVLVNIAIYNLLEEEKEHLAGFGEE